MYIKKAWMESFPQHFSFFFQLLTPCLIEFPSCGEKRDFHRETSLFFFLSILIKPNFFSLSAYQKPFFSFRPTCFFSLPSRRRKKRKKRPSYLLLPIIQLLPQNPNLLLHLPPQREAIEIPILVADPPARAADFAPPTLPLVARVQGVALLRTTTVVVLLFRDGEQARHERFLNVRERETARDAGDGSAEHGWELDFSFSSSFVVIVAVAEEFPAPEGAVGFPLRHTRLGEEVLAIEAAGPVADALVEALEVVGGADHEDAVVGFEPVDLVEEVGAHAVGDEGVEVLEHEQAGGLLARLGEDGGDGVFRAGDGGEGADVEGGYGGRGQGEGVHHGFDGDGFAVAFV